jgi:alkylhydroperoxidase family enzyme
MSHAPPALHEIAVRRYADLDPELAETVARAAAEHEIDPRILPSLDHSPRRLELYLSFYDELVTGPLGSDRLKQVIRRRVAELTELRERGKLGQHASPELPAGLAADERALVRFMDAWAVDHQNVEPGIYEELHEHLSGAELTELLWAVAVVFASARVGATVGVTAFR